MSQMLQAIATFLYNVAQEPVNWALFFVLFILPIFLLRLAKKTDAGFQKRTSIAQVFLRELAAGHTKGHDRKLFGMFHKKLLATVERGIIRGMARCLHEECGEFVAFDASSLEIKEGAAKSGEEVTMLAGKVDFSKKQGIRCSASWIQDEETKKPAIINFSVEPPAGEPKFDVFPHIDPNEFEAFGERFVTSLFKKDPSLAMNAMCDSLRNKYEDEKALAKEVSGVIRVSGGLKNKTSIDITLSDAQVVHKGDDSNNKTSGIHLQYHILGATRDIRATVKLVFISMRCQVIRYSMECLKGNMTNVIVDQQTGEKTIVA